MQHFSHKRVTLFDKSFPTSRFLTYDILTIQIHN